MKWLPISGFTRIARLSLFQPYMGSDSLMDRLSEPRWNCFLNESTRWLILVCPSILYTIPLLTPMEYYTDYPFMVWVSYNIPLCPMPSRLRSWDNAGIEEVSGIFKLHTAQKGFVESSTSIFSAGFVRNIVPNECLIKLLVHTGAQELTTLFSSR